MTFHQNPSLPSLEASRSGRVRVASARLEVVPATAPELIDITERVQAFVTGSGIADGQLVVHSLHTTAAVVVNEREPLLLEDAAAFLEALAPTAASYRHDDFDVRTVNMLEGEQANAHAHLKQLVLGATRQLPVIGGRLALGRWQRVFLVELDGPRARTLVLQLMGLGEGEDGAA